MNGLDTKSWDILHNRIGEVKGPSNYKIAIYRFKNQYRYRLWFYPLGEKLNNIKMSDLPYLGFRRNNGNLVFSGLYVPKENRAKGIGNLMFEVFTRIQDLLNLQCNETVKINKPNIAVFLNKMGFYGKETGSKIKIVGENKDGIPIITTDKGEFIKEGSKGNIFLINRGISVDEGGIYTILGTKYRLEEHNLFYKARDRVSISNKIQLYKGRIKRIL